MYVIITPHTLFSVVVCSAKISRTARLEASQSESQDDQMDTRRVFAERTKSPKWQIYRLKFGRQNAGRDRRDELVRVRLNVEYVEYKKLVV